MSLTARALSGQEEDASTTSWSKSQNRAVLIAGLTCACFSVLATLITLRWFILMKRSFRHKLIMFLICSDTFKALWYFLFPVVVFSRGPISSNSGFCQASGFFLSLGIEASDFAILMIALHSILYIFYPPARSGDPGGLYRYRKWIYPAWIGLPLLAASLAFVNDGDAYTTSGTFCYLPRRPFWYRLALSWIPRYFIMMVIFGMYTAVYVYVALKFRSFSNLQESDSHYSSTSQSRRSSISLDEVAPDEPGPTPPPLTNPTRSKFGRPTFSRSGSYNDQPAPAADPWDEVSFITSKALRTSGAWQPGVQSSDFAFGSRDFTSPSGTATPQTRELQQRLDRQAHESRKSSHAPTTHSYSSQLTGTTTTTTHNQELNPAQLSSAVRKMAASPAHAKPKDPLRRTRRAIRKQLRYMFIYPAVYLFMWVFPFASHCLLYDDYYVQHPIYWLTILATCMFSLQAAADCIVFSWREKPWRRIPDDSKFALHRNSFRPSFSIRHGSVQNRSAVPSIAIGPDEEMGQPDDPFRSGPSSRHASNNWWEAEGRKRKDSVWLGTDSNNPEAAEEEEVHDTQQNGANIPRTIEEEQESPISTRRASEAFVPRDEAGSMSKAGVDHRE